MLVPGIVDGGIDANMVPKNKAKIIPIIRPIATEMKAYIIAKGHYRNRQYCFFFHVQHWEVLSFEFCH